MARIHSLPLAISRALSLAATVALGCLWLLLGFCACCSHETAPVSDGGGGSSPEDSTHMQDTVVVSVLPPETDALPALPILDTLQQMSDAEMARSGCWSCTSDPNYPHLLYLHNSTVETLAYVWLPEGWANMPPSERRLLVHLHGHCGLGAKRFCEWYEQAAPFYIGVAVLQYWMGDPYWLGGNPKPDGDYSYYMEGQGETCGWHLNIETDIYPFIEALAHHLGASSVLLHGFSMAAATATIVGYRDACKEQLVDLVVFNAGLIDSSHYFYKEMSAIADTQPLSGQHFFFFLEDIPGSSFTKQEATRGYIMEWGATDCGTVIAQGAGYYHGCLLNNDDFEATRARILALYDSLTSQ